MAEKQEKQGDQEKEPKAKKEKPLKPCLCGCGEQTKGTWAAGHDAKLDGVAHRVGSGKLEPEAGQKALAAFPKEALAVRKERLNQLAGVALVA